MIPYDNGKTNYPPHLHRTSAIVWCPMKWLLLVILAAVAGGGLVFAFSMPGSKQITFKRPDVQLTIIYPNNVPDGSLSKGDIETIENSLAQHAGKYTSAILYLNCYQTQKILGQEKPANFQLVIHCENGCIFESKKIYTAANSLTRIIIEKISTAFIIMQTTMNQNSPPSKTTF